MFEDYFLAKKTWSYTPRKEEMMFLKNSKDTCKDEIVNQMDEPRALPMGRKEFEEWSNRIIAGALIPSTDGKVPEYLDLFGKEGDTDQHKLIDSQKFALCNQLLHIGQTESHKPDAYFIHSLRVSAIKQVAVMIGEEYRQKAKDRSSGQQVPSA